MTLIVAVIHNLKMKMTMMKTRMTMKIAARKRICPIKKQIKSKKTNNKFLAIEEWNFCRIWIN